MSLDLKGATTSGGPTRKVTAVGTVGEVGQLFTVYEANWKCQSCGQENYASRPRCYRCGLKLLSAFDTTQCVLLLFFRCRGRKPEGNNFVNDPALEALKRGETIKWKEAIDPNSYQIYYYNQETGETQWERPTELGPAPHATGKTTA